MYKESKIGYIYFMANNSNSVLYIGVTSNLVKRINEHKQHVIEGFTKKYNCVKLVYFEVFDDIYFAIEREKQLRIDIENEKMTLYPK